MTDKKTLETIGEGEVIGEGIETSVVGRRAVIFGTDPHKRAERPHASRWEDQLEEYGGWPQPE